MKQLYFILITSLLATTLMAQEDQLTSFQRESDAGLVLMEEWAPFYHGVASGDPSADGVVIWTRITPDDMGQTVEGNWLIAEDPDMENILLEGEFTTDASKDFTVKIEVSDLESDETYYYVFRTGDKFSLIGRTKTLAQNADHLRFAVVSCSNYQAGYFNAYQRIAERNDLDALIHLGDYIYEYADQVYGDENLFVDRQLDPLEEIIDLEDYRIRYSNYHLDTQLIRIHQQHPIIAVWDDHESANDAYTGGAENHTEGDEGSWDERKANARQVYFEWMPIRDNDNQSVYRTFKYGDLADLTMIDTRLEGREEQILDIENPALYDPNRTLLGSEQKAWFKEQLDNSDAKWKIIGNQVIFSEFNVGWAADTSMGQTYQSLENIFLDIWDGYPAERDEIIDHIAGNDINNVVWLTGDFHSSFAFDVAKRPSALPFLAGVSQDMPDYDPETQDGSIAVEFATPSITSANFDENVGPFVAAFFENQINTELPGLGINANPHMKFTDLDRHGYFILDVTEEKAQADYYYSAIDQITSDELFETGLFTNEGENRLNSSAREAEEKAEQDIPAPPQPPMATTTEEEIDPLKLFSLYPNPATNQIKVHFNVQNAMDAMVLEVIDQAGKVCKRVELQDLRPGMYTQAIELADLATGQYVLSFNVDKTVVKTQQFIKN